MIQPPPSPPPRCRCAAGGTGTAPRSRRRRRSPRPADAAYAAGGSAALAHHHVEVIARRCPVFQAGQQHAARSVRPQRWSSVAVTACLRVRGVRNPAGQPLQFEPVGRRDVGLRQGGSRRKASMPGAHKPCRCRRSPGRSSRPRRISSRTRVTACRMASPIAGIAHIARQHRVTAAQHVARGDAIHQVPHLRPE